MRIAISVVGLVLLAVGCSADCSDRAEPFAVSAAQPLGGTCAGGIACAEGLSCMTVGDGTQRLGGEWERTCSQACDDATPCPSGASCVRLAGNDRPGACLPTCTSYADCDSSVRETRCDSLSCTSGFCVARGCLSGEAECVSVYACIVAIFSGGNNPYPGQLGWCQKEP